ncbi:hypothetical protein A0H81_02552 [Grifola frondosa]|uniref:Uncharacterized protein n=1 Tax=Grifola frondosa TaxID=5627 RepID=A0A1C7MM91_GRIFR|nr:hypothetical protein A0H81_02552 [Grifola frondosa]
MAAVASGSSSPIYSESPSSSSCMGGAAECPSPKVNFAFAQIEGDICLVQVPEYAQSGGMSSALMVADVHVYRHEFITQFRYSHKTTVHPADMHILEPIDERCTFYEADKGTVFLARELMARLKALTDARSPFQRYQHQHRPSMRLARVHS